MSTKDPILGLHTVTTGHGAIHPEHMYGTRLPTLWWILTSGRWVELPINATLIEHRDGLVLFDTGMDPAIGSDPTYISSAIGRFLFRRIFKVAVRSEDALDARLGALGFSASDVRVVVLSHLHFDHTGGLGHVLQADLLVSEREWETLAEPHPERAWILREHLELPGAKWSPIRFEETEEPLLAPFGGCYDLMGDGSMILLPTPGHTPGSLAMFVRRRNRPPILLVGDLTYRIGMLMEDRVPGTGDPTQLRASFARVRELAANCPGLAIVASHDPDAARILAAAQA